MTQPTAWLRRAVVRNCLAALRTQRCRESIIRRQRAAPTAAPDEREFLDLLTGLNDRQRIAITLRHVDDLSESEIASALGCRPGAVKSMLHRAIQVLRARMEGEAPSIARPRPRRRLILAAALVVTVIVVVVLVVDRLSDRGAVAATQPTASQPTPSTGVARMAPGCPPSPPYPNPSLCAVTNPTHPRPGGSIRGVLGWVVLN